MSNVDRLKAAGVLDPGQLTQEQLDFINKELTTEEVDGLIKGGQKLADYARLHGLRSFPGVGV